MNNENTTQLYSIAWELQNPARKRKHTDKQLSEKLLQILLEPDEHNGWINFETWNMHLCLSNDQKTYNEIYTFLINKLKEYDTEDKPFSSLTKTAKIDITYEIADTLKEYIETNYSMPEPHEEILYFPSANTHFTYRDFQEIHWQSIVKAFLGEILKREGVYP